MRSFAAGRRYARALFALAHETSSMPAIGAELRAIRGQLEASPELHNALFRPLHPAAERRAVLARVADGTQTSRTVRNFLLYLIDQRRLVDFDGICDEYERLADAAEGRVRAEVVTASPLAEAQTDRLRRALAQRTGYEIDLEVKVDPSLIGGAVAKVGDLVFDGSLRTQLDQLRTTLTRGQ